VFDGKIFHGRTGSAAEGGHVSIDFRGPRCNCGKKGCIEALASGTAIARRVRETIAADSKRGAGLLAFVGGDAAMIRSAMVAQAADSGDALALEILSETTEYLAIWLGNIVDLLEPDVMILGRRSGSDAAALFRRDSSADEELVRERAVRGHSTAGGALRGELGRRWLARRCVASKRFSSVVAAGCLRSQEWPPEDS